MFLFYFANLYILGDRVDMTFSGWCSQGAAVAVHKSGAFNKHLSGLNKICFSDILLKAIFY